MIPLHDYLKLDYTAIAKRLSKVTGTAITPSQLEQFAQSPGITIQVAGGILSGQAIQAKGCYQARLTFALPNETLAVEADDPSFDRTLKENVMYSLQRLVYLAENPSEGMKVNGGREFHPCD